jgi:signal transduction histidine kinase
VPSTVIIEDPQTKQQAPFRRVAGVAILVIVLLVELALAAAWVQLSRASEGIERADSLSIAFTDVHRQFQELAFLSVTEPSFDTETVETELAFLQRQLSIAAVRLDDPATTPQLAGDISALLDAADELHEVHSTDPTDMDRALALADRGELASRAAVDRTATITRDMFLADAFAAERTATIVAAVAAVLLVAGAFLVWAVLLRYQRSFDEAWRIAAARQQALQATNEQLAALADTRERFVSVLSHELRSPLAVIGAAGETLHHHGDRLDPETRAGILRSLRRQVARQQRLIDDLLLVARHANTQPDPEPTAVDLDHLFGLLQRDEVLEDVEATFEAAPGAIAWADEHHVEQVVQNLVRNAEKYGGGRVVVAARAEDDQVVVTVTDDGSGVDPALQPTLFEPFTHGVDDTQGGVGLGLSITRQLIEANAGTIEYRDHEDGGAVFEFRLPLAVRGRV